MRNLSFKIIIPILASLIIPISSQAAEFWLYTIALSKKIEITPNVYFDVGEVTPITEYYSLLDEVVKLLIDYPILEVRIDGHTDSVGSDVYNLELSKERADYVMKYLISKGVPAEQLTTKGFGESDPIADNSTEIGRAKNRRVEFTVISQ